MAGRQGKPIAAGARRPVRLAAVRQLIRYHPRLWLSALVGVGVFLFVPLHWSLVSRLLVSWNCGVALFLSLLLTWMAGMNTEQIEARYAEEDESAPLILAVVVVAALLSVVAIVEPLANLKHVSGSARITHLLLAGATLIGSWLLVPTLFTTHYADLFYSSEAGRRPLSFPHTPRPAFWDFAYFSFTIAAACQTSDVATNHGEIRRLVLVHTLVSFLFNAAILGFAINVTAGLIGGG